MSRTNQGERQANIEEVFRLDDMGYTRRAIAEILDKSERTIERYLSPENRSSHVAEAQAQETPAPHELNYKGSITNPNGSTTVYGSCSCGDLFEATNGWGSPRARADLRHKFYTHRKKFKDVPPATGQDAAK